MKPRSSSPSSVSRRGRRARAGCRASFRRLERLVCCPVVVTDTHGRFVSDIARDPSACSTTGGVRSCSSFQRGHTDHRRRSRQQQRRPEAGPESSPPRSRSRRGNRTTNSSPSIQRRCGHAIQALSRPNAPFNQRPWRSGEGGRRSTTLMTGLDRAERTRPRRAHSHQRRRRQQAARRETGARARARPTSRSTRSASLSLTIQTPIPAC